MNDPRLTYLFNRFFHKRATPEERHEFMELLSNPENEMKIKELAGEVWEQFKESEEVFTEEQSKEILEKVLREGIEEQGIHSISTGRRSFSGRMVAAAAVVLVILGSVVFLLNGKRSMDKAVVQSPSSEASDRIFPGSEKAFLTLADGSTIVLDTALDGTISMQGNSKVMKVNDQLIYDQQHDGANIALIYNTISTPRGGEYQIVLSDGSKVWLNAASSLRFPIAFAGTERNVSLTGEAYFEVSKNPGKPFKVSMNGGMEVEVVGTSFNVMAYDDENNIKTTLVEGKVKVNRVDKSIDLLPMQQAVLNKGNADLVVQDADIEEAIAWKDGRFYFAEDNILSIMRKLSRWYNVEVYYAGSVPNGHYAGSIRRQAEIEQVLEILELPGGIAFAVEGKKITVSAE